MKTNNFSTGFTLIELLVVISIMIIFIGSTLAQYNAYTEQAKLKNEGKKLVDVIELAKKKASSADIGSYSCSVFSGYRVNIQNSSYQLALCCSLDCSTNYLIQNYNFPNINIFIQSGTGLFRFKQLAVGLEYKVNESADPSNPPTVYIKNSAINTINKCITISISAIGVVELNETLIGC